MRQLVATSGPLRGGGGKEWGWRSGAANIFYKGQSFVSEIYRGPVQGNTPGPVLALNDPEGHCLFFYPIHPFNHSLRLEKTVDLILNNPYSEERHANVCS